MALLNDILSRYTNPASAPTPSPEDIDHVTQAVSPDVLGKGISAALTSDQTPPMGSLVDQLFCASSPTQRAGLINQLISSLGAGGGGILGTLLSHTPTEPVTPEQASTIDPQQVQQAVTQAQQTDPSLGDTLGQFYAQHPTLVKTLGGAALAIALGRISQHMR